MLEKSVPLKQLTNGSSFNHSNQGDEMKEENEEALNDFHNYFTQFDPSQDRQKLNDALKIIQLEVHRLSKETEKLDEDIAQTYKQINTITAHKQQQQQLLQQQLQQQQLQQQLLLQQQQQQ